MTAKDKILNRLALADEPLAVHQIKVAMVSDTSCSARLREMAREGIVKSVRVPGKRFTAWTLNEVSDIDVSKGE